MNLFKKSLLFLPICIASFMLTSNYVAKATDIIQPCSTSPGEITIMCGGTLPDIDATTMPVGNYGVTSTLTRYISRGEYYYKITAPSTGYYNLDIDKLSYGVDFDVDVLTSSLNYITGSTGGSYEFNNLYLKKYYVYYVKIENLHQYGTYNGNIRLELTRFDDTVVNYPKSINGSNTYLSSSLNYVGDVDYYTFTNLDRQYEINVNSSTYLKVNLYKCNTSGCSSKTLVTNNGDQLNLKEYYLNVNLGFKNDTYKQKYLIEILHKYNNSTGSYTLNINKYINNGSINITNVKDTSVGALWESNVIFGDPLTSRVGDRWSKDAGITPKIYDDTQGMNYNYTVRELYIWDKEVITILHDIVDFYIEELEAYENEVELYINLTTSAAGILVAVFVPGGQFYASKLIVAAASTLIFNLIENTLNSIFVNENTLNNLYTLKGSLFTAKSDQDDDTFILREVSYMVEHESSGDLPPYQETTFKYEGGLASYNDPVIYANRHYFGGDLTLLNKDEVGYKNITEIFISMAK